VDHGKSTLVQALTGKFPDTHSEELKRGITIKLGYAESVFRKCPSCPAPQCYTVEKKCGQCGGQTDELRKVSFLDSPGHETLMATVIAASSIMDGTLFVIAANEECPQPQTVEHLMILEASGIEKVIVVQNKVDLVTREKVVEHYNQIKAFLKGTRFENAPVIPLVANVKGNLDALIQAIEENIPTPKREKQDSPGKLFVARSFDVNKPGTAIENLRGGVLGGILKKGILKVGDEIEIKPGLNSKKANQVVYQTLNTKILSLHKGNENVSEIKPGASISIETSLDPNLTKADFLNGCLVSKKGVLPEITYKIKIKYELFKEVMGTEEQKEVMPIKPKEMLMLNVNTTTTVGTVERLKDNEVELILNIPILALVGSNVGIARNINSHWRLIGFGEIVS